MRLLVAGLLLAYGQVALAGQHTIPLFVPSSDPDRPPGVLRIINHDSESGSVAISAIDDAGVRSGPVTLMLDAGVAVGLDAVDLEMGNPSKGLSAGLGGGGGDWRLEIDSDLDIEPLAYVRTDDRFVASMHDLVREENMRYSVPVFNSGANLSELSRLRLINPGGGAAEVSISAIDDAGAASSGGGVQLTLPAEGARTLTAGQLEAGGSGLSGGLGTGTGKWRLVVTADRPILVMNLLANTTGRLGNLSTSSLRDNAPGSDAAFGSRFAGMTLAYTVDGETATLEVLEGGRFTDTVEVGGAPSTDAGGYGYERMGLNAGRLTLTYDDGDECLDNLYFTSTTSGWFTASCTGAATVSGNWNVIQSSEALPSFAVATIADQTYTAGTAIGALTLPEASGGDGTLSYSLSPSVPGLAFDAATRRLTGTPTAAGTHAMTYTVTDTDGDTDTLGFTITVEAMDDSEPGFDAATIADRAYTAGTAIGALTLPEASGGDGTLSYSLSPSVPGLAFNAGTRRLTGTPTAAGTHAMTYTVTDSDGDSDTLGFTIAVAAMGTETPGDCRVGLLVSPGGSCTYPGTSDAFSVDQDGRARFLVISSALAINVNNVTFMGRFYDFRASHQGDGVWRIDRLAGSTTPTTGGGTDTDTSPAFPATGGPGDQTYTLDTAIAALTLPAATGGDGTLSYSLSPSVPGLSFDAATRQLTGTPTAAGTHAMTYRVTDTDGDTDSLGFTITVQDGGVSGSPDLVVQSPSVSDANPEPGASVTFSATLRNQGAGESAATTLRYYRSTDATITTADTEVGTDAVSGLPASGTSDESISLTTPSAAGTYYFGACVDLVSGESNTGNNCSGAVRVTVSDSQSEIESFDLDPRLRSPDGITYADGRFYVVHRLDKKVYAYQMSWQRDSAFDFDLFGADSWATGIAYGNGKFHVVDQRYDKVYAYLPSGQRDSGSDFSLVAENDVANGLAYADDKLYVVGLGNDRKAYAYLTSGQRDSASDFNLKVDRSLLPNPSGIAYANGRFYVLEEHENRVYAYLPSGQRDSAYDFDLAVGNNRAGGVAYANGKFHVVDKSSSKVYVYPDPAQEGGDGSEVRYEVGAEVTTLPTGVWSPDVTSGASFSFSGGNAEISFNNGGYIEEGDYRYTCAGAAGCEVSNRQVVSGMIVQTSTADMTGDTRPSFGTTTIADQAYTAGTAIDALTLPEAGGGDGTLVYSLSPSVPGLAFDTATRWLTGTPTAAGTHAMTYTATDSDGDSDTLGFTVAVAAMDDSEPSFGTTTLADQAYTAGTAIDALTLPEASGGDGTLAYGLSPSVPGLSFDATTRRLAGTPTAAGTHAMTYTVTDEDGDSDTLSFSITVEESAETDTSPVFPATGGPGDQTYTLDTAIATLTLPAASGGDGTLAYSLSPSVPGLSFDAMARQLTGTPTAAGTHAMTYTVTDEDGDSDTLSFSITVEESDGGTPGANEGDCQVGLLVSPGGSCAYPGTSDMFTVDQDGRARFLVISSALAINVNNVTFMGRFYDFRASHQGDGVWRIDRLEGSTTPTTGGETDTSPTFPAMGGPGDQTYALDTAITALTLPAASGGDGTLTYSLSPDVPGLSFDPITRQLTGTPTTEGSFAMTYTITDADGDSDSISFTITVEESDDGGNDKAALMALYNATDGANWSRSDNWGTSAPLDQWHGVTVDTNGRVIRLELPENQLSGPIPAELGDLANLEWLDLGRNALTGSIPPELAKLTNLETLDLAYGENALSGSIPPELGNLTNLTWLRLAGNTLSGSIPQELGQLGNLQRLDLDHNELSGSVPSWLGNLTNLHALDLAGNQLSGSIPPELGKLTNLQSWLLLFNNQLSGPIPPELGDLAKLEELILGGNQLSGPIPAELGDLANLERLWLDGNELSGPIPAELGDLANLQWLLLSGNQLSGCIPDGLRDVPTSDLSELGLTFCGDGTMGGETSYGVGDAIDTLPTGSWFPDVTSGGSFSLSGGNAVVRLNNGGYIEEGDYRYTCESAGGCQITNGTVDSGTIVETSTATMPEDTQPSFASGSGPGNQTYTVGTAIDTLTLPAASGGDGTLTYSLSPSVPGLTFNAATRQLTGTPTAAGTHAMTYTVTDGDGDSDTLDFTITIEAMGDSEPSFGTTTIADQAYTAGTAIDALTLPEASGGDATLSYSLSPNVPGLAFDAATRQLTGTPTAAGTHAMTYTVTDEDGDSDTLSFGITVEESDGGTPGANEGDCQVGLLVSPGGSCNYPGAPDAFSVDQDGRASFLVISSTLAINVNSATFMGRFYDFRASHQGDGVWRIDRLAGSTTPTTGGGTDTDTSPAFTAMGGPGDQTYTLDTAIAALTLPAATGGDGTLSYSLSPSVPGLSFDAATRQLTGTPTAAGTHAMTYRVTDTDGDTDSLSFTITVEDGGVSGSPDLVVESPSVSDSSPEPGASITISATVRNQGAVRAAAATLRYYRSTDATITTGDTGVGTDALSALAASSTSNQSISLTAPSTVGTYYYGACVDPVFGESNSQNNCSTAVRVTVGASQMEIESFDLDPNSSNPEGITFANDRFYVVDATADKVYAYQSSGQRDSASDFDLDSANGNPSGITFANDRFYVVDIWDDKVYAYQASGQRDAASDFDLYFSNGSASGIAVVNDRFYVVDSTDDEVYAYSASGARISGGGFDLDPANSSAHGITFANDRFYVADSGDQKVYAYQASGQRDSAADFDLDSANSSASGIAFANGSVHVVDSTFTAKVYTVRVTIGDSQMGTEGFDLAPDNSEPGGIAFANDRFYVVDSRDDKVYAYQASWQPDSASHFDLDSANGNPSGITFANDRFYVVDIWDDKVYAYQASGQRDAASDFDLYFSNGSASGIAVVNDRFYVVDSTDDEVYAYSASGARISGGGFDLDPANSSAHGITFANDRFYVADSGDQKVYAYQVSGQRDAAADFELDSANSSASGIAFANGSVHVVDSTFTAKVYTVRVTISDSQMGTEGFDLAPDNSEPGGIVFANDRFYVVDSRDDKVYAYQASWQPDSASDFDLDPDNGNPSGITFANDRFYVVDIWDDKVYAYQASGQRDAASDFDLYFSNGSASGIAVVNDRFYVVDSTDDEVYAYSASGARISGGGFDLDPANSSAHGITFANDRFYVADSGDQKVYAYQVSGQRDAAADFELDSANSSASGIAFANGSVHVVDSTFTAKVYTVRVTISDSQMGTEGFDLAPNNSEPGGIAFANDRFYVVDSRDDKVYAYQASWQPDSASDFDLDPDNGNPSGITFANDRFYVVDIWDDKVYAYQASGQRDAASDFDLYSTNSSASGIAVVNDRFYVVDSTDDEVYAYSASGARISGAGFDLDPANSSAHGITFANDRFYVADSGDQKVYAYQVSGQRDAAADFELDSANSSASGIAFANGSVHVVDSTFTAKVYTVRVTISDSQMGTEGFDLAPNNSEPGGIAFANDRFYVVDWRDDKVYAYQASWQPDSASHFDLAPDNGSPSGITFANDRFYVVDSGDDKVYAYQASGQRDAAADFDLDPDNGSPSGIAFVNDRFYVVDSTADEVYAYSASGAHLSGGGFDLDPDNGSAEGIAFANDRFFVVDRTDKQIYAYQASGQRDPAAGISLYSANSSASGIAFANDRFYVVDSNFTAKVYVVDSTHQLPDLVVRSASVSNTTPLTGVSIVLTATVHNRGTTASTAATLRYYRSEDRTISTSDSEIGMDAVSALAASASSEQSISLTPPSTAGTYYYGACVDPVSGESDTANNCSSVVSVNVRARIPDLTVASTVSDSTPMIGDSFVFTATVRNQGTSASTATTLRYYRSENRTISTLDTEVGTAAVSTLAVNDTSSRTITLPAPTAAGTYYYGACVDQAAEELRTYNNCSTGVVVFGGGPFPAYDLAISSATLHAPNFVPIGTSISMSVTVVNRGPNTSQPAKLRFGSSTYRDIPALDSGATTMFSRVRVGSVSFGRLTFRACIVEAPSEVNTNNNCDSRSITYQLRSADVTQREIGVLQQDNSAGDGQ